VLVICGMPARPRPGRGPRGRAAGVCGLALALCSLVPASGAAAAEMSLEPFTEGPPGAAAARWEQIGGNWELFLAKHVPAGQPARAGVRVTGVRGLSTTGLSLGFTVVDGLCDARVPRFEVRLEQAGRVSLACAHGDSAGAAVRFTAGSTYGGTHFPEWDVVVDLSVVFDVGPAPVILDDLRIGNRVFEGP